MDVVETVLLFTLWLGLPLTTVALYAAKLKANRHEHSWGYLLLVVIMLIPPFTLMVPVFLGVILSSIEKGISAPLAKRLAMLYTIVLIYPILSYVLGAGFGVILSGCEDMGCMSWAIMLMLIAYTHAIALIAYLVSRKKHTESTR